MNSLYKCFAHFVRMPVADVKKWCRLFGISNSLLRGLLNHASSLGRDGFDEIAQAIKTEICHQLLTGFPFAQPGESIP